MTVHTFPVPTIFLDGAYTMIGFSTKNYQNKDLRILCAT